MKNTNELEEIVASQRARISELEALVKYYEERFRLAMIKQYAPSSEKSPPPEQLGLFDEVENTADLTQPEPELEQITYTRRKKKGKRKDDLSKLPVEVINYTLTEEECVCTECGGNLHEMGHDIARRELTIIPAQAVITEHRRAIYACRCCERSGVSVPIIKAPIPEPVIKGSLASPSAMAHIMTQKYLMHSPLNRQEKDWERQGVNLSRQTMANWVIRCAEDWLQPLYDRMKQQLLEHKVLHADETSVQVLNEPGKKATSDSFMWLYRTGRDTQKHIIIFEYQPGRAHIYPQKFLQGWSGYLHTDGYGVYHMLPPEIVVVGCWSHARRKFSDALKLLPAEGRRKSPEYQAIERLGFLFHLEEKWKQLHPEERHRRRQKESKPLAEAFFSWLEGLRVLPKSALGKAVSYALEQKKWLMNVYLDGRTELSNNRIENSVRPFSLGRKNWMFCNSIKGADASSVVYSIIETAKANGLKPFEYLKFLFETLPNSTISAMDSLLPWGESVPLSCRMPLAEAADD